MIKSVQGINFQSHKDSTLDFHSGVNAVVGESDEGKTAVLRFLRWACLNQPNGDEFRSWWGGDTSATVTTTDGQEIHRERSKKNLYKLNDNEPYASFGQTVPEPIEKALNMKEENWQRQMDPHFMLSLSAPECSRRLNEVADLNDIDDAMSAVEKLSRDGSAQINSLKTAIETNEENLEEYKDLDEMKEVLKKAHAIEKKMDKLEERQGEIQDRMEKRLQARKALQKFPDTKEAEDLVKEIKQIQEKMKETSRKKERLERCARDVEAAAKSAKKAREEEKRAVAEMPKVCPQCQRPL